MSSFIPGNICLIHPKDKDGFAFIKRYVPLVIHFNKDIPVLFLSNVDGRMAAIWSAETKSTWHIPNDCLKVLPIHGWGDHLDYIAGEIWDYLDEKDTDFRLVDEKGIEYEVGSDENLDAIFMETGHIYETNNITKIEKETTMTANTTAISNISNSIKNSADIASQVAVGHVAVTNLRKFIGKKHPVAAAMLATKYGKGAEALLGAVAPALVLTYKPDSKKFMYIAESIQLSTAAAGGVELGEVVNELLEALTKGIVTPHDND